MQQFTAANNIEVNTVATTVQIVQLMPQLVLERPNASQSHSISHSQSQGDISSLTVFQSQGPGCLLTLSQSQEAGSSLPVSQSQGSGCSLTLSQSQETDSSLTVSQSQGYGRSVSLSL